MLLEKPQQPDGRGALHAAARYGHAEAECDNVIGTLEQNSPCQTLNVWYIYQHLGSLV